MAKRQKNAAEDRRNISNTKQKKTKNSSINNDKIDTDNYYQIEKIYEKLVETYNNNADIDNYTEKINPIFVEELIKHLYTIYQTFENIKEGKKIGKIHFKNLQSILNDNHLLPKGITADCTHLPTIRTIYELLLSIKKKV